jgi:hypothetical protein
MKRTTHITCNVICLVTIGLDIFWILKKRLEKACVLIIFHVLF